MMTWERRMNAVTFSLQWRRRVHGSGAVAGLYLTAVRPTALPAV